MSIVKKPITKAVDSYLRRHRLGTVISREEMRKDLLVRYDEGPKRANPGTKKAELKLRSIGNSTSIAISFRLRALRKKGVVDLTETTVTVTNQWWHEGNDTKYRDPAGEGRSC